MWQTAARMEEHAGRITIIASSTMVHQRVRCMICGRPVDHRVVFMTNDARVLHAGCIPDHVKVPTTVLLQAIRRLERMLARTRAEDRGGPDPEDQGPEPEPAPADPATSEDRGRAAEPDPTDPATAGTPGRAVGPDPNDPGPAPR